MNEIKVNLENLTETERKQLMALVDKANKSKVWKPKDNEKYFCIEQANGKLEAYKWENDYYDNDAYALGNCFKTRKEAEWAVEHLKVKAELQRFADEHNEPIDWNSEEQRKYLILYSYRYKCLCREIYRRNKNADNVYFTSKEILDQAIETIGEERLIKYYFGVGE